MKNDKNGARKLGDAPTGNCESCEFYDYDEIYDEYYCKMDLDQDEMIRFVCGESTGCPYYRFFDEYKSIVHKQI